MARARDVTVFVTRRATRGWIKSSVFLPLVIVIKIPSIYPPCSQFPRRLALGPIVSAYRSSYRMHAFIYQKKSLCHCLPLNFSIENSVFIMFFSRLLRFLISRCEIIISRYENLISILTIWYDFQNLNILKFLKLPEYSQISF